MGMCHNYSKKYFEVKDLSLDNNEIQSLAYEEDFCQNRKRPNAMKIVHEARALNGGVIEEQRQQEWMS
jgi:hypothetical protein